jgi:iron complex outermembrane receptor protein
MMRLNQFTAAAIMLPVTLIAAPVTAADDGVSISALKRMNVEDLLNIEVTSVARRPERLLAAAAAIQVITRDEIRRSGALTLAEALRLADNLQVAQRGSGGWAISARGFNTELANKLLVMIDGRTVYTPLFSGVFWDAQGYLLEDIERIEVISGPGGTLWGANAVNGVISIITRNAADTLGFHAEAGAGSETSAFAGLRYGTHLASDVHLRVFGQHVEQQQGVLADGSSAMDDWRRSQAGFRLDATPAGADAFTLQGDLYSNERGDPAGGGDTVMRGANLLGRWTRSISGLSDLSLQAYVDWTRYADGVPAFSLGGTPIAPAGRVNDDLLTVDLDFQHHLRVGAIHDVTWGAGLRFMHDKVDNAPGLAFLPAKVDQQLYSLFVQDEVLLRDNLSLTAGTKVEHNDYTGFEVEPSVRLQWQPVPTQTVWAAVSRAIRAPSRIDTDLFQPAPPYLGILYGNPDFRSEKLVAFEIGHRATFGQRFSTSIATFFNDYDDLRSTGITPDTLLPFVFNNDLVGKTWGLEFSGNLQVTDMWSLRAGYNLLEEDLRVRSGRVDISNARNETADPEQQVTLRSSLRLPGRIELDAALRWVDILQNNNGPDPGTVPHYLELDARLGWQATRNLEFSLVGRNLLDDRHPEYGFPSPARTEAERSIHGKLAWRY